MSNTVTAAAALLLWTTYANVALWVIRETRFRVLGPRYNPATDRLERLDSSDIEAPLSWAIEAIISGDGEHLGSDMFFMRLNAAACRELVRAEDEGNEQHVTLWDAVAEWSYRCAEVAS